MTHTDLTICYYTANAVSETFRQNTQRQLLRAVGETPIVSVSWQPIALGRNICIGPQAERSNFTLYWQVLLACREATTEYVATGEDDMLYSAEHFCHRPALGVMAYDLNKWSIFSWGPPVFSYRPRCLMTSLIAHRVSLLETLEERFAKYPTRASIPETIWQYYWGEPGRFDDHLGVKKCPIEKYTAAVPSIMFSTHEALGFQKLGTRKAHSDVQTDRVEPWGTAEDVRRLYRRRDDHG